MQTSDLTYREIGATAGTLPAGYHHLRRSATLGRGAADFERAGEAVLTWQMHRGARLRVDTAYARAEPGVDVRVGLGPRVLSAPCRVVRVVQEDRTRGFAYGTLVGHPVRGEESFMVSLGDDDLVRGHVVAFSVPAYWWLRPVAPVMRVAQSYLAGRFLAALEQRPLAPA